MIDEGSDSTSDPALMGRVCEGDRSAYECLVDRHLNAISHYSYRLLGNTKDTEDITQETFLRLWINANKWNSEKAKLGTWLHRITYNLCIDHLRKHQRVDTQSDLGWSEDDESTAQDNSDITEQSHRLEKKQSIDRLNDALLELTANQRNALVLCHYQGFSNKEAADIMDISVHALESILARAKRSLKKILLGEPIR